jgi:phosphate transport system permease protein
MTTATSPFGSVGRSKSADRTLAFASAAAVVVILGMLVIILGDIVIGGSHVLSWEFISAAPRDGMTAGGIFPAIFGTAALTILMTIAAVPAGVATAVYLTEYASPRSLTARAIRVCIANLAGVPSIVFGLFGLGFFISTVGRAIDTAAFNGIPTYGKPSLIWAALTLAILTLPVIVVSTEEAIRTVPRDLRDASLAVSRGAGEVAPILFTGVAYFLPYLPTHLNDPFMSLGYHVYVLATQSPDVDRTKPLLYGTVLVLLSLTFVLNLLAVTIRSRMRRRRFATV